MPGPQQTLSPEPFFGSPQPYSMSPYQASTLQQPIPTTMQQSAYADSRQNPFFGGQGPGQQNQPGMSAQGPMSQQPFSQQQAYPNSFQQIYISPQERYQQASYQV